MKEPDLNLDEAKLSKSLREARPNPALPPRFHENVWRRIESAEESVAATSAAPWLDWLARWLVRPRLAFTVAALLVLMGVGLGWNNGERLAQTEAQARYLAAVAPNALH